MGAVCREYGMKKKELLISRRGKRNEPRIVTIYLMRRLRGIVREKLAGYSKCRNTAL
jgi:hypothetical protein